MLSKIASFAAMSIVGASLSTILFVCIFTPHKTDKGTFTDPYQYWTSDAYICENFDVQC